MWCVGIDPGVNGGIAMLLRKPFEDGTQYVTHLFNMPETTEGLWDFVHTKWTITSGYRAGPTVCMESLSGYAGAGSRNTGSSTFKLGRNVGQLQMAVRAATGYFPQEVHALTWQKAVGIEQKQPGEERNAFKRRLKEHAVALFPNVRVTLQTCDALLLAEYAWRIHTGAVKPPRRPASPAKARKKRRKAD